MSIRSAVTRAGADVWMRLHDEEFRAGLASSAKMMRNFGSTITTIGNQISRIGFAGAAAGIAGGFGVAKAVSTYAEYDQVLRNIQASAGFADAQIVQIGNSIRRINRETPFTLNEVGTTVLKLSRSGLAADELDSFTDVITKLSVATGEDLVNATTVAIAAQRVWGRDIADIGDLLAKSANSSNQTLGELGDSLNYVGAIARSAGFGLEETAAAIGILRDTGIPASMAGTGLRRVIQGLTGAGDAAGKLEALNVQLSGEGGRNKGLIELLDEIITKTKQQTGGNDKAFVASLSSLFDIRGASAAANLQNIEKIIELQKRLGNSAGFLDDAYRDASKGLEVSFRLIRSAFDDFLIGVGESIGPAVRDAANVIKGLLTTASGFIKQNPGMIGGAVGGIAGILGVSAGLIALAPIVTAFGSAVTALAAVITPVITALPAIGAFLFANPITAIVGLAASIGGLTLGVDAIGATLSSLPGLFLTTGQKIFDQIGEFLKELQSDFTQITETLDNFSKAGMDTEYTQTQALGFQLALLKLRPFFVSLFKEFAAMIAIAMGKGVSSVMERLGLTPQQKLKIKDFGDGTFQLIRLEDRLGFGNPQYNVEVGPYQDPLTGKVNLKLEEILPVIMRAGMLTEELRMELIKLLDAQLKLNNVYSEQERAALDILKVNLKYGGKYQVVDYENGMPFMGNRAMALPAEGVEALASSDLGSAFSGGTLAARGGLRGTVEKPINSLLNESKKSNELLKEIRDQIGGTFQYR